MIKIYHKLAPGEQLFRQKLGRLKPAFMASDAFFFVKERGSHPMLIFKYFAVVGSALLALLFISDAYFGESEINSHFNGSLYESASYAPRLTETVAAEELRFTRDVTPADRVREVFAQFVPNEGKRGKRYSAATIIQ